MKIKTKFNVDEEAFIIFLNKIYKVKVYSIEIIVGDDIYIKYTLHNNPSGSQYTKIFEESELFKTKEELIDSLINN